MVVTDFTTNPDYAADCIISTKKMGLINSSSKFHNEITWDEKRWSSYSSAPIIATAYHPNHKYHDAPKFGLGLQCYAVRPKFRDTLYHCPIVHISMSELSGFADVGHFKLLTLCPP